MEQFILDQTEFTPQVVLNHNENKLSFEGESRPENTRLFFAPILEWIEDYHQLIKDSGQAQNTTVNVEFYFEYFNSPSVKYIMDILKRINLFRQDGIGVQIIWKYDEMDEDMYDSGLELSDILEISFQFEAIS